MNFPFECMVIVLQVLINVEAVLIDFESVKEFDQNLNKCSIYNAIEGYASADATAWTRLLWPLCSNVSVGLIIATLTKMEAQI